MTLPPTMLLVARSILFVLRFYLSPNAVVTHTLSALVHHGELRFPAYYRLQSRDAFPNKIQEHSGGRGT